MVIFEIIGIRKTDAGKYTCIATNSAGTDEANFELRYSKTRNELAPKFTSQLQVCLFKTVHFRINKECAKF